MADKMSEMLNLVITASEFRATCLGLLDELAEHGGTITVTKRGRPVVIVKPAKKKPYKSPRGAWVGEIEIVGDIVNEDTSHLWNAPPRRHRLGSPLQRVSGREKRGWHRVSSSLRP